MMESNGSGGAPGFYLRGEFLNVVPGRSYTAKNGEQVAPVKVKVLVHDTAVSVEYRSEDDAIVALGFSGTLPERGSVIELPVYASGAWDPEARRRGPVFLQGRRAER